MRLVDFLRMNIDTILQKWEEFALTIFPARNFHKAELRAHAKEILLAIATNLDIPRAERERAGKPKGLPIPGTKETAAEAHGIGRLTAGFSVNETISEYHALRASVISLWTKDNPAIQNHQANDFIKFNEAIDQALAESLASYTAEKERQTRLFGTILSASPDPISIQDLDGRFMYVNKAVTELFGMLPDAIIGKTPFDLGFSFATDLQRQFQQVIQTNENYRGELTYLFELGRGERFEYILAPVVGESERVEAIVGIARDITERKAAEEKSWHNANFDLLTGLPNRRLFRDRLKQDVKHAQRTGLPIAVLFIDLDRFKEVNDLLGHDAGDSLLRQVAERIQACVRETDTVARLGGDEFTVVLTEVADSKHVGIVANKIINELARKFHILEDAVQISGSIGITRFPQDGGTPEDLVRNADQAMYVAKNKGRNRVSFFTPTIRRDALARLKLIDDLRQAIPKQQFTVYYQPIIDLSDGRIIKAEALLRWFHPEKGLVLPEDFIVLAEETGIINEIGNWVFTEATARAQEWSILLGYPFQVSVNTSAVQFMHRAPVVNWGAHLRTLRLAKHSMSVEITEGVLLNASAAITKKLSILQEAGIDLAIDHFGTGYSSMAYLKKFDVDCLKIDQSFVQNIPNDASNRIIAETVIVMAHKLGLKVVGEGVETVEQRDWLREAGCDYAQGYLFSEAILPEEFGKLLKAGTSGR